jgi:hypothetical protein
MLHSLIDTEIWEKEFETLYSQEHFEKVWSIIKPEALKYIDSWMDELRCQNSNIKLNSAVGLYYQKLIKSHELLQNKYTELFNVDIMEEYGEATDGFKGQILGKQCPVIQKTLNSKTEVLKDWKMQFRLASNSTLYDTFCNFVYFASEYNENMTEAELENIDTMDDLGLYGMREDNCYLVGVIGTGIISTILNAMYPRLFPGHFKTGMFSLYFLSGKEPIEMGSGSSEFLMIKDDSHSKTGIIEAEHNYYFEYEIFALYSLRLFRLLNEEIEKRCELKFPSEYRYVLTNDFYQYVFDANRAQIQTLVGNDDVLKFGIGF